MHKNYLFPNEHFGLITGRSTKLQLLNVLEEWTTRIDEGYTVDVVYTDSAKAFHSVLHRRLLLKLGIYGITGSVWQWIRSFLNNRNQPVAIRAITPSWTDIISGVLRAVS